MDRRQQRRADERALRRHLRESGCRCHPKIVADPPEFQLPGYRSSGWVAHEVGCPLGDEVKRRLQAGAALPTIVVVPAAPCTREPKS